MAFQEIKPIPNADELLDMAITKANKKASVIKQKSSEDRLNHIKNKALMRFVIIREDLFERLNKILYQFPGEMTEFYKKLVEITIGNYELSKAMERVQWIKTRINSFFQEHQRGLKIAKGMADINKVKRSYYGRVSSVVKKIDFKFLKDARLKLQSFPVIKTRYNQIAIAGFPNVGKSTLLSKLSGSTPEIAAYAFTTKGIMIGYHEDVQFLDTPGTLNRLNKMNDIEQQAFLAMKMVAEKIIYVFDLSEPYPIEDQVKLYERIKKFKKPIVIYLSKTDVLPKEKVEEFSKKYKNAVTNIDVLKKELK